MGIGLCKRLMTIFLRMVAENENVRILFVDLSVFLSYLDLNLNIRLKSAHCNGHIVAFIAGF